MPDLYTVNEQPNEADIVRKVLEYTTARYMPWRHDYVTNQIKKFYDYKELRQWDDKDLAALQSMDVPPISIDRINRSLDNIKGIRENTGNKKKIVPTELGDEVVAYVLDKVVDRTLQNIGYEESDDLAFDGLLDVGVGIRAVGFDRTASGGEGEVFVDYVPTEECIWSRTQRKDMSDIRFVGRITVMPWEDAISINPEKAKDLKEMKTLLAPEWEQIKGSTPETGKDYSASIGNEVFSYLDQVVIYDVWVKETLPYKKIMGVRNELTPEGLVATPYANKVSMDVQPEEGEEAIIAVDTKWHQYCVASGVNNIGSVVQGVLLKHEVDTDHPFVFKVAEFKKSGQPRGFIERNIPHQQRINTAWAQKVAYNNKSIKSPLVLRDVANIESATQQSKFGAILSLKGNERVEAINVQPQLNLEAIEEGNIARQDMDYDAAASEPALRGVANASDSGIKLGMQQNAAITPLNKWVKADRTSNKICVRKILNLIIKNYKPERIARIIGEQNFLKLVTPQPNQMTGQLMPPLLTLPFKPDITQYDVEILDQSVSDFNKQQTFNAFMAMKQMQIPLTDDVIIKNAPIKNVDEALQSNNQARQDIIQAQAQMIQMLQEQLKIMEKAMPKPAKTKGEPRAQGGRGAAQPQMGMNMMPGGAGGVMGGQK